MGTVPALTDETPLDQYISTASQTDFTFTFMIFDTSDIKVYVNDIKTTDYVVKQSDNSSIVPETDLPMDGGKIVFNTGLANLDAVSISREIPINRLTGFSLAGAFRSNVLNTELTRMQSIMQQLERDISRSVRLSASDAEGGTFTLPSNRASTFLAFDASGNMIASAGSADSITVSSFMATVLDDTTAAAARTTLGAQAFDTNLTDIAALTCARGDILVGNSSSDWANLPIGTANKVLVSDGTDVSWEDPDSYNKNVIINGDFQIAQRGISFTSVTNGDYTLDRWLISKVGSMAYTITQDTETPTTLESGRYIDKSMKIDCTTADTSIAAGDIAIIAQRIEGYNFQVIAQKTFTISFWVRSTKTGIFCVSVRNSGQDRSYVSEYTVNSSNTWEFKTITISASPSAGTWDYTTGNGLQLSFVLVAGSTHQTTADTWQTGNYFATSNQVNSADSTSNDFRITGVQVEAGSVSTPFESRTIQTEIELCQRYYEKSYNLTTAPGTVTASGYVNDRSTGSDFNTDVRFKVNKRSTPTVTNYSHASGALGQIRNQSSGSDIAAGAANAGFSAYSISKGGISPSGSLLSWHFTADAEL